MIKDPKIKKIIRKQCKETGIDISDGEKIWESIGKFIKDAFKEGDYFEPSTFKNIYIKGMGSFHTIPKRIYAVKKSMEEKLELKENELSE
jgi:hypothetical protein